MMKIYETQEEAQKVADWTGPDWFCPLAARMCRDNCVCYVKATAVQMEEEEGDEEWTVRDPYCDNHMFHGRGEWGNK